MGSARSWAVCASTVCRTRSDNRIPAPSISDGTSAKADTDRIFDFGESQRCNCMDRVKEGTDCDFVDSYTVFVCQDISCVELETDSCAPIFQFRSVENLECSVRDIA